MAADYSQHMTVFGKQELGWVVPEFLQPGESVTSTDWEEIKNDTGQINWQTPDGTPYTLSAANGDQNIHNGQAYAAQAAAAADRSTRRRSRPGVGSVRLVLRAAATTSAARRRPATTSTSSCPSWSPCPQGTPITVSFKSSWDIEWDFDYGFVLATTDGGETTPRSRRRTATRRRTPSTRTTIGCLTQLRQRPDRHERRVPRAAGAGRGRPRGRPATTTARRSSTTSTTSPSSPGSAASCCGSRTSPTRASTGRAGSSTTWRSRPATRSSTRATSRQRGRAAALPGRLRRGRPGRREVHRRLDAASTPTALGARPRLLPGAARPLRLRLRRPRPDRPRRHRLGAGRAHRVHRRGPRLRQQRRADAAAPALPRLAAAARLRLRRQPRRDHPEPAS